MKIAIGADHAGFKLKSVLIEFLDEAGHRVIDCGTDTSTSVDYPDFARKVTRRVSRGEVERGVLICWTGIGMSISANKQPGIRAALCYADEIAALSRRHNRANVICFGAGFMAESDVKRWLKIWLETPFDGGRHQTRVAKMEAR